MQRDATRNDQPDPLPSAFPAVAPTSESTWARFIHELPHLDLPERAVTVVAPHPDDETLACGGVMSHLSTVGGEVRVLAVTDGEGSHPTVRGLDAIRRAEQQKALDALGVTTAPVRFGLPDGRVDEHEARLADLIEAHCGNAELLIAPWAHDGHCDHDVCGRAAQVAAQRLERRLLAYPVWAWQWAGVAELASVPWRRWDLAAEDRGRKAIAIAHFTSQITDGLGLPVVDASALRRFHRPVEVFADVR